MNSRRFIFAPPDKPYPLKPGHRKGQQRTPLLFATLLDDLRQENSGRGGGHYGRGKKANSGKKRHDRRPSLSARRTMSGTGVSPAAEPVQRQNWMPARSRPVHWLARPIFRWNSCWPV